MQVTMIGHSTTLIESDGRRILTDPWFGTWGNPAFQRVKPPSRKREALTNVQLVLVSHNHWDHTDRRYFRALSPTVPVVAPRATAWMTRVKGARTVVGLGKWEQREFGAVRVTAVPARHVIVTRGYVIEIGGKQVYFAGDTYSGPFLNEIGARYRIDLALVPVIAWRIPMTMGARAAVDAIRHIAPRVVVPIHLGLRPRSPLLRGRDSAEAFRASVREAGLATEVRILEPGDSCEI
jgi:L-ascorbate metabolism protein UlaG (beta-lactamase superfamily)